MPDRAILHVDMDAFFASVEQRDRPELRGRPVLIGHDGPRGVVAAASYEARPFGCRSAQPMAVAKRLCPQAIVVPGRHAHYAGVSRDVFAILESATPLIQPISIDEAFLDVTGSIRLLGRPVEIARRIRQRIREQLQLTASIGVSFNRFLAKLASDLDKPDGLVEITRDNLDEVLPPLPIERLWGVGPAAAARLHRINIHTFDDVRKAPRGMLERHLGSLATRIRNHAVGVDHREVVPDSRAKSISHEQTFGRNLAHPEEVRSILMRQAEAVGRRLRRHGLRARTVTIKIRVGDFDTITRSHTLPQPTDHTRDLQHAGRVLFERWRRSAFRAVRLIGFAAAVAEVSDSQMHLFDRDESARESRLDEATDTIVARFGRDAIHRGR